MAYCIFIVYIIFYRIFIKPCLEQGSNNNRTRRAARVVGVRRIDAACRVRLAVHCGEAWLFCGLKGASERERESARLSRCSLS